MSHLKEIYRHRAGLENCSNSSFLLCNPSAFQQVRCRALPNSVLLGRAATATKPNEMQLTCVMLKLKACDLCWGWSGCQVCGTHLQLNYLYQFTSVTFFHAEVPFCVVWSWISNLYQETYFLCQQWKSAIMANSFSLYEISPYEQVVQDKLRSKTQYCTGPVTGKVAWFQCSILKFISHIP
jgi:hypothetical protein